MAGHDFASPPPPPPHSLSHLLIDSGEIEVSCKKIFAGKLYPIAGDATNKILVFGFFLFFELFSPLTLSDNSLYI